jgi:diacylglycerol kinase (ATP)
LSRFKARNCPESMHYAMQGVIYAIRTQRNVRLHFTFTVLVVILAWLLQVSNMEWAILSLTIGLVILAEMANTAIETVVDLITDEYHQLAAVAKNVAAGTVLAAAAAAVAVGYFIFFDRLANLPVEALAYTLDTPPHITVLALVVVVFIVMMAKARSTPIRIQGGMPSAHTATAASIGTSIFFLGHNGVTTVLALLLVALVAQSRVEAGIHTVAEVIVGGLLGVLITVLTFQLIIN